MIIKLPTQDDEELLEYATYESKEMEVIFSDGGLCIVVKEGVVITFSHDEVIQMIDMLPKRFVLRNKSYKVK